MPANLTPVYRNAEERYKSATTSSEKMAALEEMLATIPKHKGTEKMQGDIKKRIAKLRQEVAKKPAATRQASLSHLDKEGAGQVILIGPPNSGKSSLLAVTSAAEPEVADYPFTTRVPLPGMAIYENVQMQYVDMPPFADESMQPWMLSLLRQADAALVVLDAGDDDSLSATEEMLRILAEARIELHHPGVKPCPETFKPAIACATKMDRPDAESRLELLREIVGPGLPIVPINTTDKASVDELSRQVFYDVLNNIRIYTKAPGKKINHDEPFVVPRGTDIIEAARMIHKDLASGLKYARVWGKLVFDGQMVTRDYIMQDGDVVEFHS